MEVIQTSIELEYKQLEKLLKKFDAEIPGISKKLIGAVNTEAKKVIRKTLRNAGYKAKKETSWGNAGYSANLKSSVDKNLGGKIFLKKDAFQYKFLEFGTNHQPMTVYRKGTSYKVKGFSVPAKHIVYPAADQIWRTNKAVEIMEKKFQEELKKRFGEE